MSKASVRRKREDRMEKLLAGGPSSRVHLAPEFKERASQTNGVFLTQAETPLLEALKGDRAYSPLAYIASRTAVTMQASPAEYAGYSGVIEVTTHREKRMALAEAVLDSIRKDCAKLPSADIAVRLSQDFIDDDVINAATVLKAQSGHVFPRITSPAP